MQEFNLCPKCGGVKDPQGAYPRAFGPCLCARATTHADAMLIRYGEREYIIRTRQGNLILMPTEALVLLAELEQERETLRRLAKEQEG